MKPILPWLKKHSYLQYALPWLTLVLPFIGQHRTASGWSFAYMILFGPFFSYYLIVLPASNQCGLSWLKRAFLYFYFICTNVMDRFAFDHRASPGTSMRDALITGCILSVGALLARRLAVELRLQQMDKPQMFPFELTAETFRLPEQSLEPGGYPRVPEKPTVIKG